MALFGKKWGGARAPRPPVVEGPAEVLSAYIHISIQYIFYMKISLL